MPAQGDGGAGNAGERDDRAGLAAFYEARAGEPLDQKYLDAGTWARNWGSR